MKSRQFLEFETDDARESPWKGEGSAVKTERSRRPFIGNLGYCFRIKARVRRKDKEVFSGKGDVYPGLTGKLLRNLVTKGEALKTDERGLLEELGGLRSIDVV